MGTLVRFAIVLTTMVGCVSPDEAPPELEDVTRTLFREFDSAGALPEALVDLSLLLEAVDYEASLEDRSLLLEPPTGTDVGSLAIDGRDPQDCDAIALAFASSWAPEDHASYQILDDLTVLGTASSYVRTVLEPDDPSCFPVAECDLLRTENSIVRESFLFDLAYVQRKDYRWVSVDGGAALLARAWLPESAHDEAGNNHIWQSFEVEVWLPEDGGSTRYYAQFSEVEYAGVSGELARSLALSGAQNAMEAAEDYLEASED